MPSKYFRNTPVWIPQGGSGGSYIPAAIKIVLDGQSVQIQKSNLTKSEVVVETDLLVPIEDLYVGLPPKIFQKKTVESAFRKLAQTAVGRWTVPLTRDSNNNKVILIRLFLYALYPIYSEFLKTSRFCPFGIEFF